MNPEDKITQDFYKEVQRHLYRLEADSELIVGANPDIHSDISIKIEELWEEGHEPCEIALLLIVK